MPSYLREITKSEGVKSTVLVTVGNIISTGLGAIALILSFRFLSPSDFGLFSAIFAMMMVVVKIADLGTNIALQKLLAQPDTHVKPADKKSIWTLTFLFKLIIGITIGLVGWLSSGYLAGLLHISSFYITIGLFASIGMIIYDQAVITAQSLQFFGITIGVSALQSVLKIVGVLTLYYLGKFNPTNLILLYGAAPLVGSILVPFTVPVPYGKIKWESSRRAIWAVTKWTFIAILSAALADNLDVLMIQSMLNSEGTGLYSAAARIAGFVSIVAYAIGIVLNVRVAKYKSREHIDAYLKKAKMLAIASFILMALSTPFAGFLIYITAGSNYLTATYSLQLLLVATGLVMATSPYVALFYTFDKSDYFAYSGIMIAVLLIVGNYIFLPWLGIAGAGYAKLITRLIVFVYTYYYVQKLYRETYKIS